MILTEALRVKGGVVVGENFSTSTPFLMVTISSSCSRSPDAVTRLAAREQAIKRGWQRRIMLLICARLA
jgi:hypothetical protein